MVRALDRYRGDYVSAVNRLEKEGNAKRIAAWREAEKMAWEEVPYIPFGFTKFLYLVKPYVQGYKADLLGPARVETFDIVK